MRHKKRTLFIVISSAILFSYFYFPDENKFFISKEEVEISSNKPEKKYKIKDGVYLLDFGKASFGNLMIQFIKSQRDSIIIHLGEQLNIDGRVNRNPKGSIRYQRIVLKPEKGKKLKVDLKEEISNTSRQSIKTPSFMGVVMPYRYCEIENLKIPLDSLIAEQEVFKYKFKNFTGNFSSSDTILNKIWNLCSNTIKATSFTGLYIDGDRERIPYEADAYINMLSNFSVSSDYTIAKKTNEYFINNPTWPTEWILHTVPLFYQYYMYSGDITQLSENYEKLKFKTLSFLENKNGLISSKDTRLDSKMMEEIGFSEPKIRFNNFYSDVKDKIYNYVYDREIKVKDIIDWPHKEIIQGIEIPGENDSYDIRDYNTVVNAFYYMNLDLMSRVAGFLNKRQDSILYRQKAIKTKKEINKLFFNKKTGVYIDGENSTHSSLHANIFPLAFNLVPNKYAQGVLNYVKTKKMSCSVYGAQYLLDGLFNYNEANYAYELLTSKGERSWWNMIESGSTMTTEAWGMKYKNNSDWNHAWGTAPLNIISRRIWGITPLKPGWGEILIKPQLAKLKESTIRIPINEGAISATFYMTNKKKVYLNIKNSTKNNIKLDLFDFKDKDVVLNGVEVSKINMYFDKINKIRVLNN